MSKFLVVSSCELISISHIISIRPDSEDEDVCVELCNAATDGDFLFVEIKLSNGEITYESVLMPDDFDKNTSLFIDLIKFNTVEL